MNNMIANIVSAFRRLRLQQLFIAGLAGLILMLNTACNPGSPKVSGEGSYEVGKKNPTELYDTNQPKEGGMNVFSDTDPRQKTKGLDAKAKSRVDQAESNIQKSSTPKEFAEEYRKGTPFGERVRNITDSVGDAAKDTTEDATEGAQRGARNLKANTDKAGKGIQDVADDATDNAQGAGKDISRKAQRAVEGATGKGEFSNDRA
jgi:hypothetical protein